MEPSLLEALGMSFNNLNSEVPSGSRRDLPAYKLKDPKACEDGCYWRWLVHALLEDVVALKRNLEETLEASQQLEEEKQRIHKTIGHYGRLVEDLASTSGSLEMLRKNVPELRLELEKHQKELAQLRQKRKELHEHQRDLQAAIKRTTDWQKTNVRKVQAMDRETEEGRRKEQRLCDQMLAEREKVEQSYLELQQMTSQYTELQQQVKRLEEKRAVKRKK